MSNGNDVSVYGYNIADIVGQILKGARPSEISAYAYEFEDLIGQAEQREALEQTQREQNQVRLHPTYRQVTMCEAVISWPHYLGNREPFRGGGRAVGGGAKSDQLLAAMHRLKRISAPIRVCIGQLVE